MLLKMEVFREFPGSPVVRTLHFTAMGGPGVKNPTNVGDTGSVAGLGRFHVP